MLDRKKLFVDVNAYRGSRARGFQESELDSSSSPLIIKQELQDSLETPSLDLIEEDQVSEAAKFFLDQPTPDIEMRGLMTNPFTPVTSNANPLRNYIKREPVDDEVIPVTSSSNQRLSRMEYPYDLDSFLDEQHTPTTQQHQQILTDSLSTPVINPNFGGNPFVFRQQQPTLASTFIEDPAPSQSFVDETATYASSSSTQLEYAPPPQSFHDMDVLPQPHPQAIHSNLSQLPESVIESFQGSQVSSHHHRQTASPTMAASTSQYMMGPYSPSGESSISSQAPSPGMVGMASRSGSFSQESSGAKRKRSTSDDGGKGKGRPTKKQQLDLLCTRKRSLENENHRLREDVAGYERACKRLKDMLYQRIRDQRA